jgi:hypothetical protein
MDFFGESEALYTIFVINAFGFCVYWILGLLLFAIEKYKFPEIFNEFKIQEKTNVVIGNGNELRKVSNSFKC